MSFCTQNEESCNKNDVCSSNNSMLKGLNFLRRKNIYHILAFWPMCQFMRGMVTIYFSLLKVQVRFLIN